MRALLFSIRLVTLFFFINSDEIQLVPRYSGQTYVSQSWPNDTGNVSIHRCSAHTPRRRRRCGCHRDAAHNRRSLSKGWPSPKSRSKNDVKTNFGFIQTYSAQSQHLAVDISQIARARFLEGIWAPRATNFRKRFPNSIFHPGTETHVERKRAIFLILRPWRLP